MSAESTFKRLARMYTFAGVYLVLLSSLPTFDAAVTDLLCTHGRMSLVRTHTPNVKLGDLTGVTISVAV